eukprot:gene14069-18876_t
MYYTVKSTYRDKKRLKTVMAHRGSREQGLPENTIAAFRDAILNGADIIELDVRLTLDDQVVVSHDDSLSRTCGSELLISQTKFKDLPKILLTHPLENNRIKLYPIEESQAIPLLSNVLKTFPHHYFNIEIKQNSNILIEKSLQIIQENNKENDVYWFSLNEKVNQKLVSIAPHIATISSVVCALRVFFYYHLGILPFISLDESVVGVMPQEITLDMLRSELPKVPIWILYILRFILQGNPPYFMMQPKLFYHLRKRGIAVLFMSVNTPADLDLAIKMGATMILTDNAPFMVSHIKQTNITFQT